MKKSLAILLPTLCLLLLAGCRGNGGGSTQGSSSSQSSQVTSSGTPSTPAPADQHITGISLSPSKPFVAQKNSEKTFKVSFSGSPTDENEKNVTWKVSDPNLGKLELIENSHNAKVTFLEKGTLTVTVTSDYNPSYTKSVDVRIIENDAYTYLWNCTDKDSKQFSNINDSLPTPQVIEDDVVLGSLEWHVKRYEATKKVDGSQNLRFGYGDKEGQVDFTLSNTKEIESIEVGCSSKAEVIGKDEKGYDISADYGSSKLTIKVGGVTYLDGVNTEKGDPESTKTPERTSFASGDVVISFSPSVGYIYLQYICIKYTHNVEEISISEDSTHKATFELGETFTSEGLKVNARYTNDLVLYDVSNEVYVSTPDISTTGTKTVNVTLTKGAITVKTSYTIEVVEPRVITNVEISGTPEVTTYFVGDNMSYKGLNVTVTYETGFEILNLPTSDVNDFTEVNVPLKASLEMNDAWSISLKYKGQLASLDFAASTFTINSSLVDFKMKEIDESKFSGYKTYVNIKDENNLVNMHIAANPNVEQAGGYPCVSDKHSIEFTTLGSTSAFKKFELTFAPYLAGADQKTNTGTISVKESILGGSPYVNEVGSGKFSSSDKDNMTIKSSELSRGCNALEISFSSANHFGLVEFKFELTSQENAIPEFISYVGELSKSEYSYGEVFSSSGLTFYVNFTNNYLPYSIVDADQYIVWEELLEGMTSVKGTFLGLEVTISGISVGAYVAKTYTLVTETLDDFTGVYAIACVNKSVIWNGSLKTTDDMKGTSNYYGVSFSESYTKLVSDYTVDHATFTISKQEDNNYYILSSSGFICGLTAAGSLQVVQSSSSSKREVKISVTGGYATISNEGIEGTTAVKQIGCSSASKFTTYTSSSESDMKIQLYKQD